MDSPARRRVNRTAENHCFASMVGKVEVSTNTKEGRELYHAPILTHKSMTQER